MAMPRWKLQDSNDVSEPGRNMDAFQADALEVEPNTVEEDEERAAEEEQPKTPDADRVSERETQRNTLEKQQERRILKQEATHKIAVLPVKGAFHNNQSEPQLPKYEAPKRKSSSRL